MLRDVRQETAAATGRTRLPWRELYDAHAAELVGYLWKLTGDREAANDLMQETFVAGMRDAAALRDVAKTTIVHAEQKNPFWLSPIFTPDGQLLYLHQLPAFGDFMQVVDLRSHALLGPVPTPTKTEQPGPFSWLFTTAYAGGVASTVPVSPDGLKVYAAAPGAIAVLRVPDLKPLATLAPGYSLNEVWISGDGKTVYATDGGTGLLVMREDGSGQLITVTLPAQIGGFVASEHG